MFLNLCSGTTFPCIVQVKSLHMWPKSVCAWAPIRISALEINTTAPEKARPHCVSYLKFNSHMPTLKSCSESDGAPSSASRTADRLTRNRNEPWGAWGQSHVPCSVWVWTSSLPHAGRARGHHEVHQQSQNFPKVKQSFFPLSLCYSNVFYCLGTRH